MPCPVVKIKSTVPETGGYVVINESDFDPATMERFVEAPPAAPHGPKGVTLLPPPPQEPSADDLAARLRAGTELLGAAHGAAEDPLGKLPKNWQDKMESASLRALAQAVSGGRTPEDRTQAVAMVEQALASRKG
jgi:hypothetical protein